MTRFRLSSLGSRYLRPACLAVALGLATASAAAAQDPAKEFWPEIDAWWRLSPAWRLSLFVPVSENLDTHYREGNLILQGDYAFGQTRFDRRLMDENRAQKMKVFLLRGGSLGGKSLDDQGEAYTEHSALAELHVRIPIKGGFLLSHRFRTDFRFLGDDAEFSMRYRYRVMLERELTAGRTSLVPYVNGEGYYDSRYESWNRVRLIAGTSVSWSRWVALEGNGTYQYQLPLLEQGGPGAERHSARVPGHEPHEIALPPIRGAERGGPEDVNSKDGGHRCGAGLPWPPKPGGRRRQPRD